MAALRSLLCLVTAAVAAAWIPAAAQVSLPAPRAEDPPRGVWLPGGRSYLGLNPGRSPYQLSCESTAWLCDGRDRPSELFMGTMAGDFWGVELGYLTLGRLAPGLGESRQGLSLSLVGKTRMGASLGLFGKVGARADTSVMGASGSAMGAAQGVGLSYGAGLSFDFSPRLSASLEWDSNDFRFASGGRDPVRSTSLGLRFRY